MDARKLVRLWARSQSGRRNSEVHLMMYFALLANREHEFWPSWETIQNECSVSRRTIAYVMAQLQKEGLIVPIGKVRAVTKWKFGKLLGVQPVHTEDATIAKKGCNQCTYKNHRSTKEVPINTNAANEISSDEIDPMTKKENRKKDKGSKTFSEQAFATKEADVVKLDDPYFKGNKSQILVQFWMDCLRRKSEQENPHIPKPVLKQQVCLWNVAKKLDYDWHTILGVLSVCVDRWYDFRDVVKADHEKTIGMKPSPISVLTYLDTALDFWQLIAKQDVSVPDAIQEPVASEPKTDSDETLGVMSEEEIAKIFAILKGED